MQRTKLLRLLLPIVLLDVLMGTAVAQDCAPPAIARSSKTASIFSPEQEMILGELTYQNLAREMRFVRDPQLVAHLEAIADRLIKRLPPTGLKFNFFIIDIPEANAFNVPGGYVFVSRKLIGFSNNEDELAAVVAHELGHAVAGHGASEISRLWKRVLNITQVGDRKDIANKYNLLIERWRTKNIPPESEEDSEQQEADRLGLYMLVAAGYDASAVASFFGRLVESKAGSSSWFTDIFGRPKPEDKRLREMVRVTQQLPAQCRDNPKAMASQDFLKWQADVVSYRNTASAEVLPGLLWKKELSPKLRSDISHFAFSNNGKFILAQDEFAITVIRREPLTVLFQIPINDAHPASFTPDGDFVVFGTRNLRYEKWSVSEKKPVQVRELVLRRDCWEHEFSPDGNYVVCFDYSLNLNVLDIRTGKKIWEKKDFYRLTYLEYYFWEGAAAREELSERKRFFHIRFSPDSQFLMVARTNKFRFKYTVDLITEDKSDDTVIALDLKTLKPIDVGGEIKTVTKRPFLFLDSGRILGMPSVRTEDAGIFSFPGGKRLERFNFGAEIIQSTGNPNYVVIKPLGNARMGIFDLSRKAIVSGSDKIDVAIWDKFLVFESISGEVRVSEISYDDTQKRIQPQTLDKVEIPVAPVGEITAADVSNNLEWLAASSKTRGAVWNLGTGDRKLFVRGFRGALLADNGTGLADFPKNSRDAHALAVLDPSASQAQNYAEVPERGFRQYGRFLLVRKSLKEPKQNKEKENDKRVKPPDEAEAEEEESLQKEVSFELRNVLDGKLVFSREFRKEAPSFFFDSYSGRLILYWTLGSEVGKSRLKEDAALAARAKELGNRDDDYLVEIVDCFAGKTVGTFLLETGKGSFSIDAGLSDGDWLVLHDSENRILVYSIAEGRLRQRFFGATAAINLAKTQVIVENQPGELTVYSLETGDPLKRLNISGVALFVRFTLDGKKLFVLSGAQAAYAFDVERLTSASAR